MYSGIKIRDWSSKVLLLGFSFFVALMVAELAVRMIAPQNLSGTWRVVGPRGYRINKANGQARHQFGQRVVHYQFNEHHLRGEAILSDRIRVLCLGDSFTFGWLLEEQDTYIQLLNRYCDQELGRDVFQFLNGAAGGWGAAHYLAYLEDFGDQIQPHMVIVFLSMNDMGRSVGSGLYTIKDRSSLELEPHQYHDPRHGLKQWANAIPGYQFLLHHSHLFQLIRQTAVIMGKKKKPRETPDPQEDSAVPSHPQRVLEPVLAQDAKRQRIKDPAGSVAGTTLPLEAAILGQGIFKRLKAWCDERDTPLLVLTTGFVGYLHNTPDHGDFTVDKPFFEQAETFFHDQGTPFTTVSLRPQPSQNRSLDDLMIPGDRHPNERGAQLVAESAWPWLKPHLESITTGKRTGEVTN